MKTLKRIGLNKLLFIGTVSLILFLQYPDLLAIFVAMVVVLIVLKVFKKALKFILLFALVFAVLYLFESTGNIGNNISWNHIMDLKESLFQATNNIIK